MMRLSCPYCGERDEVEFHFGGEENVTRPDVSVSDAIWSDYLFNRENAKGLHQERWVHSFGCGQWFKVARSTTNHDIVSVCAMDDALSGNES